MVGLFKSLLKLKVPIKSDSRLCLCTAPVPARFYFLLLSFRRGMGKIYVLSVEGPDPGGNQPEFDIIGEQQAKGGCPVFS